MTVGTTLTEAGPYVPDGGTVAFPFGFKAASTAEIKVVRVASDGTETVLSGYTVTLGTPAGGTVTFTAAPLAGDPIYIYSDPSFQQQITLANQGDFSPTVVDEGLDRATLRSLALRAKLDRALVVPRGEAAFTLPNASARAGAFLAFDGGGDPIASSGTGADAGLRTDLAAATGPALVGLGNGSKLGDIIRVNAASYGMRPGRSSAQNLSAITTAINANGNGPHPVVIDIPPAQYDMDPLAISLPNVWIDAHGSTFTGNPLLSTSAGATGFRIKNARFYVDTASPLINLSSSGGGWANIQLEKFNAGDGYMAMIQQASDNVFIDTRLKGGNGIFIEGERMLFNGVHGVGRAAGGDDFLVFKARNVRTGDIEVKGAFAKNYANGFAAGSEIGTLQAASTARAGRVENVNIEMTLRDCAYGLYLKPGAVDGGTSYDWRDGLIRGIRAVLKIDDATGTKLRRGVVISPARNALVEWIDITLRGEGRFTNAAETLSWAHIFLPDSTGWTGGGAGGTVRDVSLDVWGFDPYAGVDNGVGSAPGYPPIHGVVIEKQASGVGTVDRIKIKAKIDGTKSAGINVGPGCDNAVTISEFSGRNLVVNPVGTNGGWTIQSAGVQATGCYDISVANATYRPIYLVGSGDIIGRRLTFDLNGAAGVDSTSLRQLACDAWLRKAVGIPKDTVGASGTVYFSIELRAVNGLQYDGTALDGNPLSTFNTSATSVTALTPFSFPAFPVNVGAGSSYEDRFLKANTVIRAVKTNTGGGQPFVGSVDLHYVQIGPAA